MCGIVGYIGARQAAPIILESLKKLQYRGYDSAGIAVVRNGHIAIRRSTGKLSKLEEIMRKGPLHGTVGIGHVRWATHGKPSKTNAHPHRAGNVVVVHNGIIDNYLELKEYLVKKGTRIISETDTEIVAHLVEEKLNKGSDFISAVQKSLKEVQGQNAMVFLNERDPDRLIVASNSSSIAIGEGKAESFIASDILSLLDHTRKVAFLEDGEIGEIRVQGFRIWNKKGQRVKGRSKKITWNSTTAQKGGFRHFMLKEINEQPQIIASTFRGRISPKTMEVSLDGIDFKVKGLARIKKIHLVACGTAWHAALVGKFLLEEISGIPTEVDYGSEFRYRAPLLQSQSLLLLVSQSGETADTIAALHRAKNAKVVSICNVVYSSLARKSDGVLYTHAGPEISVASTKAFTAQLTALYLLAIRLGQLNGHLMKTETRRLLNDLLHLPRLIEKVLTLGEEIQSMTKDLSNAQDFLYLGRGINYPIALEGALKLKEISYIHAEGYPAGEMKHGPIALIDKDMPVVILIPKDRYFEKSLGNLKEVESRGGKVIAITDEEGGVVKNMANHILVVPKTSHFLTPTVLTVPLQLFAYYMAVHRGTDIDQPRNLAKSVTVE